MTLYERELLIVKDLRKLLKDIDHQMDESQKALDETMSEKIDLQERIDKAIEYINKMCLCTNGYVDCGDDLSPERIVNILRGYE